MTEPEINPGKSKSGWKILMVIAITISAVYYFKLIDRFQGMNRYLNEGLQVMAESEIDTSLVIVAVTDADLAGEDSIGTWVQQIAKHKPRVIAVDFQFYDSALAGKFEIDPSVKIICGLSVDGSDTLHNVNVFRGDVEFGNVMLSSERITNDESLTTSLPWKVAYTFDPAKAENFKYDLHAFRYIRYPAKGTYYPMSPTDTNNVVPGFYRGKVVVVGYFGFENDYRWPHGIGNTLHPSKFDNADVHLTPAGDQFGAYVLVSTISTILHGSYLFSNTFWDVLVIVLISLACFSATMSLSHLNKKYLYLLSKFLMAILFFVIFLVCLWTTHHYNLFMDCQAYITAAVISTEMSFWLTLK